MVSSVAAVLTCAAKIDLFSRLEEKRKGLVPGSYQTGEHALPLLTESLHHLENVHRLLLLGAVQKVPQATEDPRPGGAVAEGE